MCRHKLTNAEEAVSKDIIEVIRAKRQFDSCEMLQGYNCPNKAESDRVVRKWGKEIICLLWEAVPAGGTICTKTMEVLVPTD